MSIFITGSTGYIGSYVVAGLLRGHPDRLSLLVRAKHAREARERLWRALQLHMDFDEFSARIDERVDIYLGDITEPQLGLTPASFERLAAKTNSIIHIAASLNRKSAKACLNVNLRGSLEVLKLARAAHTAHGLRRISDVSTVAVAGMRSSEIVYEDSAIDWNRSDYDPYARTKKFAEHMLRELLPDVPHTVFRPSIVLGDSRQTATTQFDMVRAFALLARFPVLPFRPEWRLDIVPADYVGRAIVELHQRDQLQYSCYHLSSGRDSLRYDQIVRSLQLHGRNVRQVFAPRLNRSFDMLVNAAANAPRSWLIGKPASLLKVFLPYLCFDTVFDNTRVTSALGERPRPFSEYASRLLDFAIDHDMTYPYEAWPERTLTTTEQLYA
jgi:thioester reductase-like protein